MLFVQIMFHLVHAGDVFPVDFVASMRQDDGSFINLRERPLDSYSTDSRFE
jgi:hypothetical protein